MPLRSRIKEVFSIDRRSLALFRICLALLILFDLYYRITGFSAHYTDFGVLPRNVLLEKFSNFWHISLHLANGAAFFQALLFLVAAFFALMLLVGYRTRLATIATWLLLISLHSRNYMVLQGGDTLLRMMAFWGMFLPLGSCFSFDAALNNKPEKPPQLIFSTATVAALLQTCFVYWFTALSKTGTPWWEEGTAVYNALSIDQFTTTFGAIFLDFPQLCRFLTHFTIFTELAIPTLIFVTLNRAFLRTFFAFWMMGLHLGFMLCMRLGPFPFISATSWTIFLPSWFWDKIFARLKTPQRLGTRIFYGINHSKTRRRLAVFKSFFLIPETEVLPEAKINFGKSWYLIDAQGNSLTGLNALIHLMKISPLLWPVASLMKIGFLKNLSQKLYEWIAKRETNDPHKIFLREKPYRFKNHFLVSLFVLLLIPYVFLWNVRTIDFKSFEHIFKMAGFNLPTIINFQPSRIFPQKMNGVGFLFRIDQSWSMFGPQPLLDDGWYVIPGKLKNGQEVDLFKALILSKAGTPQVVWEKPLHVADSYPNERWRKYMMNLYSEKQKDHRLYFGRYLCRAWNNAHPGDAQLDTFTIDFMLEKTQRYGQKNTVSRKTLWNHACFDKTKAPAALPSDKKETPPSKPNELKPAKPPQSTAFNWIIAFPRSTVGTQ